MGNSDGKTTKKRKTMISKLFAGAMATCTMSRDKNLHAINRHPPLRRKPTKDVRGNHSVRNLLRKNPMKSRTTNTNTSQRTRMRTLEMLRLPSDKSLCQKEKEN